MSEDRAHDLEHSSEVTQEISGHHHQVAGHDIINEARRASFNPENPNIIDCPQCWEKTGRYSEACPHCGFNVAGYHLAIANQQKYKRLVRAAALSGVGGLVLLQFTDKLGLASSNQSLLTIVSLLLIGIAFCFIQAADKIQ